MERTVIVGAGQAGGRAVVALREHGYAGEIILIGQESAAPYERPPLSKEVLLGDAPAGAALVNAEAAYRENSIELRLGTGVQSIDPAAHELVLMDGTLLEFNRLVLATGACARRLSWPESNVAKPYYLRDCEDAVALRRELAAGKGEIAVVGGGFIGLEVAASARKLGWTVTVIELGQRCLERVLPSASAKPLVDLHMQNGTQFRWGASVVDMAEKGSKTSLFLDNGESIDADAVVVGVGSQANIRLAEAAGLECGNGIIVDGQCRTSAADIYAIGDVAMAPNRWADSTIRLESWENAERQAEQVARVICGQPKANDVPPWFWTDQFDQNIQIIGVPAEQDQMTLEPGNSPDQYVQLYHREGLMTGAVLFNSGGRRRGLTRQMYEMWDAARSSPGTSADNLDSIGLNA